MSDNNLVNIKGMSDEQNMQAIGQDDGSNLGTNIPRLAINRTPEDDDGNQLPVGHFYTYDSNVGQNVFGKPVTFRPFISAMQYMHYDAVKGEYINRSIIFKSWKEEAIDILGGTRCGRYLLKRDLILLLSSKNNKELSGVINLCMVCYHLRMVKLHKVKNTV